MLLYSFNFVSIVFRFQRTKLEIFFHFSTSSHCLNHNALYSPDIHGLSFKNCQTDDQRTGKN